ncbi:MAG: hypothetical protein KER_00982 [Kerstersia gyiorum]|uniref:nucleotide pyrophosphatase n=1 Tax=Kerstersia gyiorum TaxID=206506 RepID=UPI0030D1033B
MPLAHMKKLVYCLVAAFALAGCGSSNDSDPAQPTDPETQQEPRQPKTLVIGMDGVRYDALLAGIEQNRLPNLASLTLSRAWTGGTLETGTQQPTLLTPGWATLLTGSWATVHEVRSDALNQQSRATTLFEQVKNTLPGSKTGSAVHSASLASLLSAERSAGYLDTLTDCAQIDACVTDAAGQMISSGYDVVLAQFAAPLANLRGPASSATYKATVEQTDKALGSLLDAVRERQRQHSGEDWQVIVTSAAGLGDGGNYDGLPRTSSKTTFYATSLPTILGADQQAVDLNAAWDNAWETLPSAADLAPTVLAHLDAASGMPALSGSNLAAPGALRRPRATPAEDYKSVTISWTTVGQPAGNVTLLRDGEVLATLESGTSEYTDDSFAFEEDGLHTLNYEIRADDSSLSISTQIPYTKPVLLMPSLKVGVLMHYSFDQNINDIGGQTQIVPFDGSQQPVFLDDGPFGKAFRAERKDRRSENINLGGYKLEYPAGSLDSLDAVTIGLWYRSKGDANDKPIVANKDYNSGGNAGITIAQWNGNEVRFNIGGSGRADLNGFYFTPNEWAYLLFSIDKTSKKMTAAVFDPTNGLSVRSTSTGAVDLSKLAGVLGAHFGLNEDGKGTYNVLGSYEKGAYTMDFSDLTFWGRALSEEEIRSLALSGKSVRELLQ